MGLGMVSFNNVGTAAYFAVPPLHFGLEFTAAAIIGMCAMSFVSAKLETVGDVSGIRKGGANRGEATDDDPRRNIRWSWYSGGRSLWWSAKHLIQPKMLALSL